MGSRPAGPVLIRGGGELASAAARLLFLAGFEVAVLEREAPLAVRRRVCLAEAVFSGTAVVEETAGRLVPASGIRAAWETGGFVPVAVDPDGASLAALQPEAVVDGRMAKRALDTRIDQAAIVVGLGPGFVAGVNVHAVVETQRGASLGRVIWRGRAAPWPPVCSRPSSSGAWAWRPHLVLEEKARNRLFSTTKSANEAAVGSRQQDGPIDGRVLSGDRSRRSQGPGDDSAAERRASA